MLEYVTSTTVYGSCTVNVLIKVEFKRCDGSTERPTCTRATSLKDVILTWSCSDEPVPDECKNFILLIYSSMGSSLHISFTPNWKHYSLVSHILIHPLPLPPSPSQLQTPFTIAVCLSDSGFWPLPIDFVLVKRLWISSFPRLRFCGRSRNNSLRLRLRSHTLMFY